MYAHQATPSAIDLRIADMTTRSTTSRRPPVLDLDGALEIVRGGMAFLTRDELAELAATTKRALREKEIAG